MNNKAFVFGWILGKIVVAGVTAAFLVWLSIACIRYFHPLALKADIDDLKKRVELLEAEKK